MRTPFVILGTPRSRTAWLSTWLTDGGRRCHHDALATAQTRDAIYNLTKNGDGLCETAGALMPRVLRDAIPNARYLIVRRDRAYVAASLERCGAFGARSIARLADESLDTAKAYLAPRAEVHEVSFDQLDDERTLAEVWNYLRGDEHDAARTRALSAMRVTKINPFAGNPPAGLLDMERRLMRSRK